jgi:UDP:flavonoid glycosyltransferase YjiC (YdhE family)
VHETGFGIRLPTFDFEDGELAASLDRLLVDEPLRARCATAGKRLRERPGTVLAADLIEDVSTS